jgi:hypothetical protein
VLSYYFTDFGKDQAIAYPKAFWHSDLAPIHVLMPNEKEQDEYNHILSQTDLSNMLWELHKRQREDKLDMFRVQNCCCFLRFGRWGPSEFKNTSNDEPPWNPDDLCIAILHGFGETESELKRIEDERKNKKWKSIFGSGSASQHKESIQIEKLFEMLTDITKINKEMKTEMAEIKKEMAGMKSRMGQQAGDGRGGIAL